MNKQYALSRGFAMSQNKNLVMLLVFLAAAFLAFAEVPTSLTYQGKLVEGGQPVDGTRAIGFRLYVDTGDDGFTGSPGDDLAWEQAPTTVSVNHGIFSWELAFTGGFTGTYLEIQDIFGAGHDLYLQVHVGPAGSAWGACTPLIPADKITTQGFAFGIADKAVTPAKLADGSAVGQLLQYNGTAWVLVDGSGLGNVADGTIDGQTARWNNTSGQWEASDVLTNDGSDLAVTGDLTITGEAGYSDVADMGTDEADLVHKKYVDDLVATAGDDWGSQVVETDASLTGDGVTLTELGIATDGVNETHVNWGLGADQVSAEDLLYDNTTSGLAASDVQDALDEIADGGSANYWGVEGNDATSVASNFIGTINNTGLAFRTNDTERMRLQNSGQLTIGSTTAGGKLDVHQTSANDVARFINYGDPSNIRMRRTQGTQASPTATSGANTILGRFYAEGYDGSGFTSAAALEFVTDATGGASDDMPGRISFLTTPDGTGALEERMRIRNNGFVGINKTDPASYLDVGGDANVDGNLTVGGKLGLDGHDPAPAGAVGEIYVNSADGKLYYHNGTIWEEVATGAIATSLQDAYIGGNTITTAVDADPVVINAGGSGAEALYVGGTGGGNAIKTNGHLWMETGNLAMDDGHINVTDAYNGGSVLFVEQTGSNRVATFSNNAMSMSPAVYINNSGGSYALQTSSGNVVVDNGALWLDGLARIDGEVIVRDATDATTFYVNNTTGQTQIEGKLAVRESDDDVFNVDGTSGQIWTGGDIYSEGMIHVQESGSDVATIHGTSGDFWTRGSIYFEGTTEDVNETRLTVIDPTAPRTITFPNESGTVLLDATLSENDPVVTAEVGIIVSDGTNISSITNNSANWNTAFSWGDHSLVGYLTSADLDDYWNTSDFTASDITNWNTAYGWGDHSLEGYLTSETDPIFNAWLATPPNVSVFTNDAGYITIADVVGTNIAQGTRTATTVPVTSSTGSDATLDIATTALAGVMSAADKTKLDGIEAGATGNQDIELTGDDLGLTGSAVTVDLSPYMDNTDAQTLSVGAGTVTTSLIQLTGSSNDVTLEAGSNVTLSEAGNTITIASTDNDTWQANTQAQNGYVTAGGANNNMVWKTDGSGAPAWRADNVNDADADPTNEYNTSMGWNAGTNTVSVTDGGGAKSIEITGFMESTTDNWVNESGDAMTGQLDMTGYTGAPFVLDAGNAVMVSNLNADLLDGQHWSDIQAWVNANDDNTTYSAGSGIDITGTTISNTAPDQTVGLSAGTGIAVAGTYPNFTITNTAPSSGGTVTSVTASSPLASSGGATPNITINQANGTQNGYLTSADWNTFNNKLESGDNISELVNDEGYITLADVAGTNIAQGTRTATTVPVTSSTGSDATLDIATTALAGVMSAADKTKLDGIANGANNYVHPNHTGDVTSSGDGATVIANDAVTNAKLANMAANTIKGRISTAGDPQDLTATQVRTILNVADGANNYVHPNHTGDVTSSGDGATVIANNAVTYAKMQTVSAQRLLGNPTASAAVPSEITVSTGLNLSLAGVLTATGSGGTVTNIATNNGITGGPITGTGTIGLTGQALALHNLASNGMIARTGSGTVAARTITWSGNGGSVTNGNGVSGNPTISLSIGTGATQVAAGNHGHTNMVTGTGTAGYTARWATSATLEASSIQDNGAGNIGINRSPSATYRLVAENGSNAKAYLAGNTWGVYGEGDGAGVYGVTGSGPPYTYGILGHGSLSCGVYGSSPTYGVRGNSLTGTGVYGEGSTNGVYGSGTTTGVRGEGSTYGVRGEGTYGVYGSGTVGATRYGIYGTASGGTINWAGYFNGNVATNGYLNIQNITAPGAGNRLYANSGNLYWDGTLLNTGGATPGGANTQVQYNNSGTFAGSADFTWNNSTKVLTVGGANPITINGTTGKIDCKTVDPVIEIEGEKYATYNWDGIGLRTDVVGVAQLTNGEFRVDMAKQPKASDLWLFYHAVAETSIIPFVTPQDPVILMARVEGSELVVRSISGEENARFGYRLSGVRIDMVGTQEEINIRTDDPFPHIKVTDYDKNGSKLK